MKDLYIHVGTHKTGTTTIQSALRVSADCGYDRDWFYIRAPKVLKEIMRSERYDGGLVNRLKHDIDKCIPADTNGLPVVLSAEALSGYPIFGYLNSSVVYGILRDATLNYNVKIIIYLRCQDDFVESMYAQSIHEGGALSFDEFLEGFKSKYALDYSRMVRELIDIFGQENVILKSYHQASDKGILNDFGGVIGSRNFHKYRGGNRNLSYSNNAIEIARICNRVLDDAEKKKLRKVLQSTMSKGRGEKFSYFSGDERILFMERFSGSNNALAKIYCNIDFSGFFPVRKVDNKSMQEHANSNSNELVAALILKLINDDSRRGFFFTIMGFIGRGLRARFFRATNFN